MQFVDQASLEFDDVYKVMEGMLVHLLISSANAHDWPSNLTAFMSNTKHCLSIYTKTYNLPDPFKLH